LIGHAAGTSLTTGETSIAIGHSAMTTHTTGTKNIAIGHLAMSGTDNLTGSNMTNSEDNIFIGYGVAAGGWVDSEVRQNVAIGSYALDGALSGLSNTVCVGHEAGGAITSGDGNTCIGNSSGTTITTGASNTIIGKDCDVANGTGAIVVGNSCDGHAAGTYMTIGTGSGTDRWWIHYGSDTTWARESDKRLKKDITDSSLGLDFVNDLRAVKYRFKTGEEQPDEVKRYRDGELQSPVDTESFNYGMLAQDVKSALDTAGVDDWSAWSEDDNGIQSLSVASFVVPLIKAVQELSAKVTALENA